MSESLGSAVLDLTTDASGLERGLDDADSTTKSRMGSIAGTIGKGAMVAGAAIAAVGTAAVTGAFKVAAHGDALDKTSSKLGVHTDFLQDAQHWANQNGLSHGSMERAVGRLNQRIGRAADGNDKYAEAFEHIGVSVHDAGGDIRDTEDVMRDTIDALQDIEDPAARSAAASELFGTKMARDLMPALEDGSLSLEDATAAMDEHGRMSEDQVRQAAEFTDAWDNIKTSAMSLIRDGLTPVMGMLADRVFPFVQERIIPALQRFGDWIGPRLQAAAQGVVQFFETSVVPAFQALGAWWTDHGPAIVARATELWTGIQTALGQIGGLVEKVVGWFSSAEEGATGSMGRIHGFVDTVWPQISEIITTAVELIGEVIGVVLEWVESFWDAWGDTLMSIAGTVWDTIVGVIDGALSVIQGILDVVLGAIQGDWGRVWEGIKGIFSGVWDAIVSIVSGAVSIVWDYISNLVEMVSEAWTNLWEGIRGVAEDIVEFFSDAGSWLLQAGKDIIGGLIEGITGMVGNVGDAMGSVADKIRGFLPFSPAREGPLRRFPPDEAGRTIGEMVGDGIGSVDLDGPMVSMVGGLGHVDLDPAASMDAAMEEQSELLRRLLRKPSDIVLEDGTLVGRLSEAGAMRGAV